MAVASAWSGLSWAFHVPSHLLVLLQQVCLEGDIRNSPTLIPATYSVTSLYSFLEPLITVYSYQIAFPSFPPLESELPGPLVTQLVKRLTPDFSSGRGLSPT